MERTPIESRTAASVAYDEARRVLEVEYRGGGVYQYLHVPPVEWENLMRAASKGRYLNWQIKPRYRFVKVE